MMVKVMAGIVALAIASTAVAGEVQKNTAKIPSVKAGKCSITLLDADGIKPLAGATLKLQSVKDAKQVISTEAGKSGLCVVDVKNGRYILSVNDKVMTLFDVADDGKLAWCRIVVSESPMLIGGQDEAEDDDNRKGFVFFGLTGPTAILAAGAAGVAGAAAVVVGGDYADAWDIDGIDDSNDKDDDSTPTPAPTVDSDRPPPASR